MPTIHQDFALARYTSDGTLDTTFSGNGKVVTDFLGGNDYAYTLAIQSNGKIVAGGGAETVLLETLLWHATPPMAAWIRRFSSDGKVTTDFSGAATMPMPWQYKATARLWQPGLLATTLPWPVMTVIRPQPLPQPALLYLPRPSSAPPLPRPPSRALSSSLTYLQAPLSTTFIRCMACRGIVSGYPDGTFRPGNNVTRGQLSKIVANAAGFNDPQTTQMFEDVPIGSTFFDYIGRLASRGYMSGHVCGGPGEPCVAPDNLPYVRPNANASRGANIEDSLKRCRLC